MDKLECINTFISVVECGNFSKASRHLGITRNLVAKRIRHLELIFNTSLFVRNTREMNLTYLGEKFYQHSKIIISEFEWANKEFTHYHECPEGKLRINASYFFRHKCFTEIISKFMIRYPKINIELFFSDKYLNVNTSDIKYDIIFKVSQKVDDSNTLLLGIFHQHFYTTTTYLEKYSRPISIDELQQHSLLLYSQIDLNSKIVLNNKNKKEKVTYLTSKLTCNNANFLLDFCNKGQGIIYLPDYLAKDEEDAGKIVRCLEDYRSEPLYLYALITSEKKIPKKVKLFLDHLTKYLSIGAKTLQFNSE